MNPELKAQIIAAAMTEIIHWAPWIAGFVMAALTPLVAAAFSWLREHTKNATIVKVYDILEKAILAAVAAGMSKVEAIKTDKTLSDADYVKALQGVKDEVIAAGMAAITPHLPSWLTPAMLDALRAYASDFAERVLPMVRRDFSNGASVNPAAAPVSSSAR